MSGLVFLFFRGFFVKNTCSLQAFNLKFRLNSKTNLILLIKTWELKIGLASSLLHYDIITLLNCKRDCLQSKILLHSKFCYILGSLCQTSFTEYSYRPKILCLVYTLKIFSVFQWLCYYFGLIFTETCLAYVIA